MRLVLQLLDSGYQLLVFLLQFDVRLGILLDLHLHVEDSAAELYDSADSVGIFSEFTVFSSALLFFPLCIFVGIDVFLFYYHLFGVQVGLLLLFFLVETLIESGQLPLVLG